MFLFGNSSNKKLDTVNEIMQKIFRKAITRSPIDFGISHGKRLAEEQYALFTKVPPVTKCDGYIKISKHQDGNAVDIYAYVNGKASYDPRYVLMIAGVILSTALEMGYLLKWGGDFDGDLNWDENDSWDKVHFEFIGQVK